MIALDKAYQCVVIHHDLISKLKKRIRKKTNWKFVTLHCTEEDKPASTNQEPELTEYESVSTILLVVLESQLGRNFVFFWS